MSYIKYRKNNHSTGFTLVEMIAVLAVMSFLTLLIANRLVRSDEDRLARTAGRNLYQYINAVRSRITNEPGIAAGVYPGVGWLQNAGCGGTAPDEYYPCGFVNAPGLGLNYNANLVNVAGNITVTLNMGPLTLNGNLRGDLSGLMAKTANAEDDGTIAGSTSFFNVTSDPATAILTVVVRTNTGTDPYLRVDGTNTMNADINFDPTAVNRNIQNAQALNGERVNLTIEANAPIFRDSDDPLNYFVDPNANSNLNNVDVAGSVNFSNPVGNNIDSVSTLTLQTQGGAAFNINPGVGGGDVIVGGAGGTGMIQAEDVFIRSRNALLSDLLPKFSHKETYLVSNGDAVPKPVCPAPALPRIIITMQHAEVYPVPNVLAPAPTTLEVTHVSALDAGATWTAFVGTYGPTGFQGGGRALAQTYCLFP